MPAATHPSDQEKRIPNVIESDEDLERFQEHLKEIVEGAAFKGSQRSAQFLTYIVQQAIAGNWNSLKERMIGVELFGRSPTYDTGDDAIVRVTASDVRKRLLQHYGRYGSASEFRISLPAGHYVPEIIKDLRIAPEPATEAAPLSEPETAAPLLLPADPEQPAAFPPEQARPRIHLWWIVCALLLAVIGLLAWMVVAARLPSGAAKSSATALPWSVMLHNNRTTMVITSDPNIAEIQGLIKGPISTSDYANQIYIPAQNSLSPEMQHFAHDILRGDKAANVDVSITASIAALAEQEGARLNIRGARDLRLSDLDNENNFIFIGSPLANPWASLFNDQLDFRFFYNKATLDEIFLNMHPRPGEARTYIPTAKGFATGQSFATVSFIANPDHSGQVLLLAGLNAEGTKATGELVSNADALQKALAHCGMTPGGKLQHFQLLLRLNTMAGSPRHWDVMACHILN